MLDHDNDTLYLEHDHLNENELEELFAKKALIGNPGLLENPFVFEKLCYALNGMKADFNHIEPPTLLTMAMAVKKINHILKDPIYNTEIKYFIALVAQEEGWLKLPSILSFAQDFLDELLPKDIEVTEDITELQNMKHKAVEKYLQ